MAIVENLEKYGIEISKDQGAKLEKYMDGILEANQHINLTAIKEPGEFIYRHYIDSLAPLAYPEFINANEILDLGTGGGFPGIPLAILNPDKRFVLLDSLNKRLKVIQTLCHDLGIDNVETIHGRAEDIAQDPDYRQSLDLCVSRAVAELRVLAEYALPFVRVGGFFFAYKSKDIDQELEDAQRAIDVLGGKVKDVQATQTDQTIVVIEKIKDTPSPYPRKAGQPKRSPL